MKPTKGNYNQISILSKSLSELDKIEIEEIKKIQDKNKELGNIVENYKKKLLVRNLELLESIKLMDKQIMNSENKVID